MRPGCSTAAAVCGDCWSPRGGARQKPEPAEHDVRRNLILSVTKPWLGQGECIRELCQAPTGEA